MDVQETSRVYPKRDSGSGYDDDMGDAAALQAIISLILQDSSLLMIDISFRV